tara:strand:+ start:266 stop:700 length:435 start_codon:yes stop_codon:yes gene_type:complete
MIDVYRISAVGLARLVFNATPSSVTNRTASSKPGLYLIYSARLIFRGKLKWIKLKDGLIHLTLISLNLPRYSRIKKSGNGQGGSGLSASASELGGTADLRLNFAPHSTEVSDLKFLEDIVQRSASHLKLNKPHKVQGADSHPSI